MKCTRVCGIACLALSALISQSAAALAADNLTEAQRLYKLRDFSKAGQYLQAALKEDPDDASAHYLMGNVYTNLNRRDDAIKEYHLADDADPVGTAGQYSRQALATLNRQSHPAAAGGIGTTGGAHSPEESDSLKRSVKAISSETSESERNEDNEFNQRIAEINRLIDRQVSTLQAEMQERIAANGTARFATLPNRYGGFIRPGGRVVETYNPEEENAAIRAEYAPKIQALQSDRNRRIEELTTAHKAKVLAIEEQSTKLEQQYLEKRHLSGVKLNPSGTDRFTRVYETGGESSGGPVPVQAAPAKSLSPAAAKSAPPATSKSHKAPPTSAAIPTK